MAKRNGRMISSEVCQSDAFRFLPASSKSLYLQMVLSADDDGFVDCVRGLIRADGDSESDTAELSRAGFIYVFPSGVCLILHWRYMNTIPKDRYQPTIYAAEMSRVRADDETGVYSLAEACYKQTESLLQAQGDLVTSSGKACYKLDQTLLQASPELVTQEREDKKEKLTEEREERKTSLPIGRDVTDARAREDSGGVILSDEERSQLVGKMGEAMTQAYVDHLDEYIARTGKRYPSHFRVICEWYAKDKRDGKLPVVDGAASFDTDDIFEAAVRRQYGDAADQALGVYNG